MLVLTRDEWEDIVVTHAGERLRVRICNINRGKIKIGLEGPKSFMVHRGEVQAAIDELAEATAELATAKEEPASAPC